jgi:hypothetical protein
MAHTCNFSYSGGRDWEYQYEANPGQTVLQTLSWKYPKQNRAGRVAQVLKSAKQTWGPEFKPQSKPVLLI